MERDRISPKSDIHLSALGMNYSTTSNNWKQLLMNSFHYWAKQLLRAIFSSFWARTSPYLCFLFVRRRDSKKFPSKSQRRCPEQKRCHWWTVSIYMHSSKGEWWFVYMQRCNENVFWKHCDGHSTEMDMPVLLVISHKVDQKPQQRKRNLLDYLSLVNLDNKFGMVRDLEKWPYITQN